MRRPVVCGLTALLLAVLGVAAADAKCALKSYALEGVVRDARTKRAVEGAWIFVFLDGQESTLPDGYASTYPDFMTSARTGNFEGQGHLDPFNGFRWFGFGGEKCDRKLRTVEIVVTREGYLSQRKLFGVSELELIVRSQRPLIRLPPISLFPSPRPEE